MTLNEEEQMEENEMLEQTNETEKDETLTSEENEEMETDAIDDNGESETEDNSNTEDNSEDEDNSEEQEPESAEKPEKTFTQEELNSIIQDRLRKEKNSSKRNEESIRKEYDDRLSEVESILNAGFGTSNLDEGLNRIRELCKQKGIEIPKKSNGQYSKDDLQILANANAQEIINDGYDAIENELSRLTRKGADKMSEREQLVFLKLDDEKKKLDSRKELKSVGAKDEILESKEYNEFADKFAGSKFSSKEIYEMYIKDNKPKEKAEPIGSMKNPSPKEKKTFITEAEYDKMSEKEIEENMDLIHKSMSRW
jgi:hypothetical protein